MRTGYVLLALVLATAMPAPPAAARPDRAAAQAANTRGMQLLTAKKYKEAMAEFHKAIAADPDHVLAHYNLACAASRAHDEGGAEEALRWVESAAAWDQAAAKAAAKAPSDPDLKWFLDSTLARRSLIADPGNAVHDLLDTNDEHHVPPAVAKALASAPGKHDDQCDATGEQARVAGGPLGSGKYWVVASLRDGVGLFEGAKLLSRTDPLGCTGPGESQDRLASIGAVAVPDYAPERAGEELVVVAYGNGGRRMWSNEVAVYALRNDTKLEHVFDATLQSSDEDGAGTLEITDLGDLVLGPPGAKQKRVFRWDAAAFRYVELKR